MDHTHSGPWTATGALLGTGLATKAFAPTVNATAAKPWLITNTVILAAGLALLATLLRSAVRTHDHASRNTGRDDARPDEAAIRRPVALLAALALTVTFGRWAEVPMTILLPAARCRPHGHGGERTRHWSTGGFQ